MTATLNSTIFFVLIQQKKIGCSENALTNENWYDILNKNVGVIYDVQLLQNRRRNPKNKTYGLRAQCRANIQINNGGRKIKFTGGNFSTALSNRRNMFRFI